VPIPTVWRWWSRADLGLEEWVSEVVECADLGLEEWVSEVVEPCRSRPGGVGLGLEVVESCWIWVFFFLFNSLVLKLWNLTLVAEKLILWWFLVALG
jgi:hypothetical protein